MKLIIGNGTPVDGVQLDVEGSVVKLYGKARGGGGAGGRKPLLLGYHLHPGEKIRLTAVGGEETYEVTQ